MKMNYKKLMGVILAAVCCFSPVSAFAAETSVNITSGLDLESEEVECTFDESRILYGEAEPSAEITFTISTMDRHGDLEEVFAETVVVGSMGLFSVTLPLEKGNNYIEMMVEGEDEAVEVVVKRVSQTVKNRLQRMIALPGMEAHLS